MPPRRPPRVGLLSPQSNRNLGDTATFAAAIAAYRSRLPGVELVTIVPEPAQSAHLLGTAGFPLYGDGPAVAAGRDTAWVASDGGRFAAVRRIFGFVRELDAIVFTGGGQLDDFWGGTWGLPFWLFVWTAAARLCGVRVAFHAIGYDRLSGRGSRWLALGAMRLAHYRSVRDAESREILTGMGLGAPCEVLPDLAFALEAPEGAEPASRADAVPYVVINPVSHRMWSHGQDASYEAYLKAFADLSRWLLERGLAVVLASTQDTMDAAALEAVAAQLKAEGRTGWTLRRVTRLEEFMSLAQRAQLVVSSRLHGLILSLASGTPAVSVSPMRKMTRLMHDVGLGAFNVDMAKLSTDTLIAVVERALATRPELCAQVARVSDHYRRQLGASFDFLAGPGLFGNAVQHAVRPAAGP